MATVQIDDFIGFTQIPNFILTSQFHQRAIRWLKIWVIDNADKFAAYVLITAERNPYVCVCIETRTGIWAQRR